MSDDNLSQRERRRQQHEASKPKVNLNAGALKQWAWPIGLVVIIGGVAGLIIASESAAPDCPGHWHSGYSIWINDGDDNLANDRVPFDEAAYTVAANNIHAPNTHIHADDGIYHWHPAIEKCNSWDDALTFLGVDLGSNELTLDESHADDGLSGSYTDVRVFQQAYSKGETEWTEVSNLKGLLAKQPKDGDSIAILVGDYTDEEVQDLLDNRAATLVGNTSYGPDAGQQS